MSQLPDTEWDIAGSGHDEDPDDIIAYADARGRRPGHDYAWSAFQCRVVPLRVEDLEASTLQTVCLTIEHFGATPVHDTRFDPEAQHPGGGHMPGIGQLQYLFDS